MAVVAESRGGPAVFLLVTFCHRQTVAPAGGAQKTTRGPSAINASCKAAYSGLHILAPAMFLCKRTFSSFEFF